MSDDAFVEEVRRAADIVRVISESVSLKKMGTSWKGLCPFHQEKTPSFNVRSEPPVFHCFGCGEGGDVFKFLMLHERVSFPEALQSLARRFGVPIPERGVDHGPGRKEREEMLAILEVAADHYARALWTAAGARARDYLLGRGFKKETLERIRAGAARDAWEDLLSKLRRTFPVGAIHAAGLVLERQGREGHYDRFRNRAIFPILNEAGQVVAFGARSLDGSEPKYLNSPETPVYQKSRTLYGLSWAKEAIRTGGSAVLMEGYLDVARALEGGIQEAVATCGTALTSGQARLLRRFGSRVIVNFDQDEAGQKAARKSFEVLLEEGLDVRVVALPEGHDPDSFLKAEGPAAYRQRLAQAPPYMEWLIERAAAENDIRRPQGKAAYLDAILPALARIDNAVERAAWLPRVIERGGLDEAAAQQELRRAAAARSAAAPAIATAVASRPALLPSERWLLALILTGADGVNDALGELAEAEIRHLRSAPALRAAKAIYLRGEPVTAASLAAEVALEDDETQRLLTEIAVEGRPGESVRPAECVKELKRLPLRARMAEIQRALTAAEGETMTALLREKSDLRRLMADS